MRVSKSSKSLGRNLIPTSIRLCIHSNIRYASIIRSGIRVRMLIKIKRKYDVTANDTTGEAIYQRRCEFIKASTVVTCGRLMSGLIKSSDVRASLKLDNVIKSKFPVKQEKTSFEAITTYNNFYELGKSKKDPKINAHRLTTSPWNITIEGEYNKPGEYNLEDFVSPHQLEERIYPLRCIEAWSMVIPWIEIELGKLLKIFEPNSRAKFVEFHSIYDPENLPGQLRRVLDWPYKEGLRIDEEMHPLTILAVGLYGKELPSQNGAPIRLIVSWKYGFKSIKSIVKIRFMETKPSTAWNTSASNEYGFYSSVNPLVPHPRWSQKRERRIGDFFKRDTLPFNGFSDQVAHLYQGMDLSKNFYSCRS